MRVSKLNMGSQSKNSTKTVALDLIDGTKTTCLVRKGTTLKDVLEKTCSKRQWDSERYMIVDENNNQMDLNLDASEISFKMSVVEKLEVREVREDKVSKGKMEIEKKFASLRFGKGFSGRSSKAKIEVIEEEGREGRVSSPIEIVSNAAEEVAPPPEEPKPPERPKSVALTEEEKKELIETFTSRKEYTHLILRLQSFRRSKKAKKILNQLGI